MLTARGLSLAIQGNKSVELAPQGLAELRPIIPQGYYYAEHQGMSLEYQFALYGEIYVKQPWVHAVVNKRAEAVARLPINVWDIKGGTRELDLRSAYSTLMADPCPYMDPFSFWGWVQRTIDIYGETYLAIHKNEAGQPNTLMPMHPSRVSIRRDPKDGVYTYYFQAGSGVNTELVSFTQDEVVPFKLFNPMKLERGMSKMEALRSTIFAEDSSRNASTGFWKNAARPNIVLETDRVLGRSGRERLQRAFDGAHAGSTNAGRTLVLEDGVKANPLQVTMMDMQYIESRHLNREEVCGVYDVAPPMVHILDRATFSNISAQMRAFYRDTMAPVLEFIQSTMDKYVGGYWARNNIMRFAVDEVIRGDFEVRMEAAHKALTTGVMTPNEARDLVGLNRYEDPKADRLYANSAIQELGMPAEQIKMQGEVSGTTPDGVNITPAQTPVASTANPVNNKPGKPSLVPKPARPVAVSDPAGPQPDNSSPSGRPNPHVRAIKRALGRDRDVREFALHLAAKYPDELDVILEAVKIAIGMEGTT